MMITTMNIMSKRLRPCFLIKTQPKAATRGCWSDTTIGKRPLSWWSWCWRWWLVWLWTGCILAKEIKGCRMIESNPINVDAKKAFGFSRIDIRFGFAGFFGRTRGHSHLNTKTWANTGLVAGPDHLVPWDGWMVLGGMAVWKWFRELFNDLQRGCVLCGSDNTGRIYKQRTLGCQGSTQSAWPTHHVPTMQVGPTSSSSLLQSSSSYCTWPKFETPNAPILDCGMYRIIDAALAPIRNSWSQNGAFLTYILCVTLWMYWFYVYLYLVCFLVK